MLLFNQSCYLFPVPRIQVILWSFLITLLSLPCPAHAAQKSLPELEREATEVLSDLDNITRRNRIAPVFELAARYAALGRTNDARTYYTKALEHEPWNLEGQLDLAELLHAAGNTNAAREKAELAWARAETDSLLARAAQMLARPFTSQTPASESWPGPQGLALVPIGEVDTWLLQELRNELPKLLHIPVIIHNAPVTIPKSRRDPVHLRAEDLRMHFSRAYNDPQFQGLLLRLRMTTNSLLDDEKMFQVSEAVLSASPDKTQARSFREDLAVLRRLGPQWDAGEIIDQINKAVAPRPGSQRGYLAITKLDLYANQSRFVFGLAGMGANCGVLSYRRYTSAILDEPPDRDRLKQRTLKQALSTTGLLFGLSRCTSPTCARAYANSLPEHDAKQLKLCSACQEGFAEYFRSQPQTPQ